MVDSRNLPRPHAFAADAKVCSNCGRERGSIEDESADCFPPVDLTNTKDPLAEAPSVPATK